MYTKKQVQDMLEKDLRQKVLIPLLKAMQYQDVHEYHGPNEFGKDIVCWDTNKLGNRENTSLVVKATAISGQSNPSADIENQVRQSFTKPYTDRATGAEEEVDHCWVVSNKPISPNAVGLITAGIGHAVYAKNVTFIGIDKLWELIEKHMPLQAALQKLEDVRHEYETLDTHYRVETRINGDGIQQTLAEKFPGAAQEKPLTFHMAFEFPNTDEGREHMEAVERFRATGRPVKIPATYIKNLEYPDILKQVYPAMTAEGFLQFGPMPHPKPLLLQCEILCDDGDRFVIDYIHFICIQAGQKEITLTNESQPIPFKVQLVVRVDGTTSGFHMSMEYDGSCNIHQQLRQLQCIRCISKPYTMRFTNLETGMSAGCASSQTGGCEAPDEDFMEALAALDALQTKSDKLVYLPDRDLSEEEFQDIAMLRSLFRTGTHGASWSNASASMLITDEDRVEQEQMLQRFADGEGCYCIPEQEEILSLFGEHYMLGPIKSLSLPVTLENWTEIKDLLDQGYCGTVQLKFVPRDDGHFSKEYAWWRREHQDRP